MRRFLMLAFAAALLAFSGVAGTSQAGTISLLSSEFKNTTSGDTTGTDVIPPSDFKVFHKFGNFNNVFKDTFKFTVANVSALWFDVTTKNHVLNMTFTLYDTSSGKKLFTLSGFQGNAGDKHITKISFTGFLLDALLAYGGDLTLKITGAFCGCASYNIAVAETPIPPALLLFLTGLGGVGFMGWRRKAAAARAA